MWDRRGRTIEPPWEPTERMSAVLNRFQELEYQCTVTQGLEGIVSCRAWQEWHRKEAFSSWWQAQADRFLERKLPRIKAKLADAAETARKPGDAKIDVRAVEIMLQRYDTGYAPRSRTDISGTVTFEDALARMREGEEPPVAPGPGKP